MSQPISVVVPVYDGVTQLGFTGPHQFLSRTRPACPGCFAGSEPVGGPPYQSGRPGRDRLVRCALVPGGGGCLDAIENDLLSKRSPGSEQPRAICFGCTGSLVLGAAGFLRGRRAACHWAWRDLLPSSCMWMRAASSGTAISIRASRRHRFRAALIAGCAPARGGNGPTRLEYAPQPPFNSDAQIRRRQN